MLVFAQPTITSADMVTGTYTYTDVSFPQGTFSPGSPGANVTWNLANVQSSITGGGTVFYGVCPSIPECSTFPTANRYLSVLNPNGSQTDDKNMYLVSSSQIEALGGRNETANSTLTYTDTYIELKFPTVYLQSFTDTSSVPVGSGGVTSTSEVTTADGYGTLITPAGTYTNVLRVKKETILTNSFNGNPSTISQTISYTWYKNNREQIATFVDINNSTFPISAVGPSSFTYTTNSGLATEESQAKKSLIIYPNPVKDGKLWINATSNIKIKSVTIYDMTGKQVFARSENKMIAVAGKYTIDLQNYPNGNYIVKIITDKNTVTETIQINGK